MQSPGTLAPYARKIQLPHTGSTLFYYDSRPDAAPEAPVTLLLHGLGDEADTWRHVFQPLSERSRVLAPDLPGFGRSGPLPGYTIPALIEALLAFMDALKLPPAVLIGNSLGAMLAQSIALGTPQHLRSLVLVDGALVVAASSLDLNLLLFLVPGLGEWLYTRLASQPEKAYASLRPYYADLDGMPEEDRNFLYERVQARVRSRTQRRAYLGLLRSSLLWVSRQQKELPGLLRMLEAPTRLVWGQHDHLNSIDNGHRVAELQPDAQLTVIPAAGHLPHQETPGAFVEALLGDGRLWGAEGQAG